MASTNADNGAVNVKTSRGTSSSGFVRVQKAQRPKPPTMTEAAMGRKSRTSRCGRPISDDAMTGRVLRGSQSDKLSKAPGMSATSRKLAVPEIRDGRQETRPACEGMATSKRHLRSLVAQVSTLVLRSLPERLSDEFLATSFGIEVLLLRRAFRVVCGTTLYAALHALRIEEVKRRLDVDVNLTVETAMRQCGFGSFAHFRQDFQKRFGIDPKKFRKKGKQELRAERRRTSISAESEPV